MPATVGLVIADVVAALRRCGRFELVTAAPTDSSQTPLAAVLLEGTSLPACDDRPDAAWLRVELRVVVRAAGGDPAAAIVRAAELCDAAAAAIMADPYRGGLCRDLPCGRATEVGAAELSHTAPRPQAQMSMAIRCHAELEGQP
jgi:hypothetical protein